jgi:hypothetical protein
LCSGITAQGNPAFCNERAVGSPGVVSQHNTRTSMSRWRNVGTNRVSQVLSRKRNRRTDLAVKQAFYGLADEKRETILVACSK